MRLSSSAAKPAAYASTDAAADTRRRVMAMRALFRAHSDTLRGVALIARKPES